MSAKTPNRHRAGLQIVNLMIDNSYTGQKIRHSDGVDYAVIDTSKLDFTEATLGKKTKDTLVKAAAPGEVIVTNPGTTEESHVTAKGGELIFINELPGGKKDRYIPRAPDGTPNGQNILSEAYELVSGDVNRAGAYYRPKGPPSQILHEAVSRPSVILEAWGPGSHQFLTKGATLKLDNGRVTGIDKNALNETWSVLAGD